MNCFETVTKKAAKSPAFPANSDADALARFALRSLRLPIHHRHRPIGITRAGDGFMRGGFVDPCEIVAGKCYINCTNVFLQVFASFCAGNRYDVVALRQNPGQRQLRRRAFFRARDSLEMPNQIKITLEIFALESWRSVPVIMFRQMLAFFDLAGQEPATKRTVWHEADAKLATYA